MQNMGVVLQENQLLAIANKATDKCNLEGHQTLAVARVAGSCRLVQVTSQNQYVQQVKVT